VDLFLDLYAEAQLLYRSIVHVLNRVWSVSESNTNLK